MLNILNKLFSKFCSEKINKSTVFLANQPDWNHFYRAFEDRFRGSSEHIKSLLKVRYREIIASHLALLKPPYTALDLGCGRGEMLTLLAELGCHSTGVDSSDKMFGDLSNIPNIILKKADILQFLASTPSNSLHFISLIHVIEHCPSEYTFSVLKETHRILQKSGILLLETPSLYSLWSASRQFYLDPTHKTPLHPEYLQFLLEYLGYKDVQTLEFSPPEDSRCAKLANNSSDSILGTELLKLEKWLFGPMDLGIIAKK